MDEKIFTSMCYSILVYTIIEVVFVDRRKVQKVGFSTMSVSLPSAWIKKHSVLPGDTLLIKPERDGSLKLMVDQLDIGEARKEYVINADACDEPGMIERLVVGSYILGRDSLQISSSNRVKPDHLCEIRGVTRKLIGMGILEEKPNTILLQCSIDPSKFTIGTLGRRLSTIADTMLSETIQAFFKSDVSLAKEAISREEEADKIYYLAVRLLLSAQTSLEVAEQIGVTEPLDLPTGRLLLQYSQFVADYVKEMAKMIIDFDVYRSSITTELTEEICSVGKCSLEIFEKATDCVFTKDIRIASRVIEAEHSIKLQTDNLMQRMPEVPFLRAIVSSLSMILEVCTHIAGVAIDLSLENPDRNCEAFVKKITYTAPASST